MKELNAKKRRMQIFKIFDIGNSWSESSDLLLKQLESFSIEIEKTFCQKKILDMFST